ncbi:MAG: alpha/beta fold hydrolase [Chloroflexota bacterium]
MTMPDLPEAIDVRVYGDSGWPVVLLHGGPGAAGYMAPVARELSDSFRVFEPLQRASDDGPLTVQRHIDDLHEVILSYCCDIAPVLVGHSWGAMLALAYAACFPGTVRGVVLIGCGTFDVEARAELQSTINERTTPEFNQRLRRVTKDITDPDVRLCVLARFLEPLYTFDPLPFEDETEDYDSRGHDQTWNDMLRLQQEGVYPKAFEAIEAPVLMLHGSWDPHPGRKTFETLSAHMQQLQYVELRDCGHYPWRERHARDEFYLRLRNWLLVHTT